jgi:hypothetical protein
VSGGGYAAGELVNVTYETGLSSPFPSEVPICRNSASTKGSFSCMGQIPAKMDAAGAKGPHKIKAKEKTSLEVATTTFTLT